MKALMQLKVKLQFRKKQLLKKIVLSKFYTPQKNHLNKNLDTQLALFKSKKIRKTIHQNEWWFVVQDVVAALTDSNDPKQYINRMRQRDEELKKGWVQFVHPLSIKTEGSAQKVNCANTESVFRIIQSIPSPKAEPFKRWLAKVGFERIKEIEDPELSTKRARMLYKLNPGADENKDYEILTAEISKATFGLTPAEYKNHKGLKRQNLRDHKDDFELIFTMLGEFNN